MGAASIRVGCMLLIFPLGIGLAQAHTPVEFLEVVEVVPAQLIEHDVELKTQLDNERVISNLEGPVFYSQAVGAMNRDRKKPVAYLNWFKISNRRQEPTRNIETLDLIRGGANKTLKIGSAEFLLSPAQRITSGAPEAIPEGLDLYKAYRVLDSEAVGLELTLTDANGDADVTVGKPLFVCLPTSQWHHEESILPSHPKDCLVVYEVSGTIPKSSYSTIDQFGLNELSSGDRRLLCTRAAFLRMKSE